MGLAASQARFLGLTARKASCIFKSTQLAQEKLEISNQLADISNEYANAMNATRLMWCNESVENDYALSYSLLMMPSAANDYNPYFITSKTGAIVLNDKYAAAAKAAGISMNGAVGTQDGRDKFIAALAYGGVTTQETANELNVKDYEYNGESFVASGVESTSLKNIDGTTSNIDISTASGYKFWNATAGVGGKALDKGTVDTMYLSDMISNPNIGGINIDWFSAVIGDESDVSLTTKIENALKKCETENVEVINNNGAYGSIWLDGEENKTHKFNDDGIKDKFTQFVDKAIDDFFTQISKNNISITDEYYYNLAWNASNGKISQYIGIMVNNADYRPGGKDCDSLREYAYYKYQEKYEEKLAELQVTLANKDLTWKDISTKNRSGYESSSSNYYLEDYFNVGGTTIEKPDKDMNGDTLQQLTVVKNGEMVTDGYDITNLTIGDLLSQDIVIMLQTSNDDSNSQENSKDAPGRMSDVGKNLLKSIASTLGYGNSGHGLNTDDASNEALNYAYNMVVKNFLSTKNIMVNGNDGNEKDPYGNSAWENSQSYNRITTTQSKQFYALNLSNMISAFLTYYDNSLRGADSINDGYIVGRAIDPDNPSKNFFVTENPSYSYIAQPDTQLTEEMKQGEFYDMLYNNICLHGWRQDDKVDHSEYLESAIKDGRYQMMSLNSDGWYYQTRYNHTGYMQEEQDDDAIARAEAEYNRKKAELTYKEDFIDTKTRNVDAEIAELNAEMDTVKSLISKNIEKTFTMYQQ